MRSGIFHSFPVPPAQKYLNQAVSCPQQLPFWNPSSMRFSSKGLRPTAALLLVPSILKSSLVSARFNASGNHYIQPVNSYYRRYASFGYSANMTIPVPPQEAPTWNATAAEIRDSVKKAIDEEKALLDDIAAQQNPTFDSTIKRLEALSAVQTCILDPLLTYQHVSTDKDLRDASTEGEEEYSAFSIEAQMRTDVYESLKKVFANLPKDLDAESLRVAEKTENSLKRAGLALDEETRNKVIALRKKLSTLSIQYSKNLSDEDGSLLFTTEELDGLPKDILDQFSVVDGKHKISFKYPDVFPALRYCKVDATRKAIYTGFDNRTVNNDDILLEGVKIRAQIAKLLGYKNHAEYVLENRMAKKPENVSEFLDSLKERLAPMARQDLASLLKIKEEDYKARGLPFDGKFYAWDNRYYTNILLENEYKVDNQEIANYFSIGNTIDKILELYEKTLRIKVFKVEDADKRVWHEDVHQFHVWDASESGEATEFLGWFYLDLHPRPNKYGHAANFNLSPGYLDESGKVVRPVTALVCNFSKPTATKPSLLKHDEVVTLFHEMGHGIHNLVSKTKYARFHGTSVERDFVEAPSQMLEFWPWNKAQLKELSSHYETKAQLPDDLIDSLIKSKHVNDGMAYMRQNFLASFDLSIHRVSEEEASTLDMESHYNNLREQYCYDSTGTFKSHQYSAFGHLMGGYDAGYYGYLWSEVFAADMYYTKFKANPLDSQVGYDYKTKVLGPGGSRDATESLKEFLGREPNNEAFLEELGVSSGSKI